jgi:hypothetical protein
MNRNTVDREETGSKVLSARLKQQEWKHFQEILRNYKIQKSNVSDQLRELLRVELWRSRRYARSQREFQKKLQNIINQRNQSHA